MSLSIVSQEFLDEEAGVLNEIFLSIDASENILFNAGAGSGKTYALIESLRYILKKYGSKLKKHNQKVVCITYTNVAVNEVKERLGNSDMVEVSTIHEMLWRFIRLYKKELLLVHVEKLEGEVSRLSYELEESQELDAKFGAYRALSQDLKESFKYVIIENKSIFYDNYDKNAAGFKGAFGDILNEYNNIISNVSNFKKIVGVIYKIRNYELCLQDISDKRDGYRDVNYNPLLNSDRLHRMSFSHDTLLEYAFTMVNKYDLLKQVILDSHPYILIDEYQDTNPNVIDAMELISNHSNEISHDFFIGYFGDKAQNIYDDGVGCEIVNRVTDYRAIDKRFNRRSNSEIIKIINKIRNDDIEQESIYQDHEGGDVKFYYSENENKIEVINSMLNKYSIEWDINSENKLHCLVLTNKLVAELCGFSALYGCLSESKYYKKNYDYLNTEFLSHDLSKLGSVPSYLYKIVHLKSLLENPQTPITDLLSKDVYSSLSFLELKQLVQELNSIVGDTVNEYARSMFTLAEQSNSKLSNVISELFDLENLSYPSFIGTLMTYLNPNLDVDDVNAFNFEKNKINALLDVDLIQYRKWYKFINEEQDSNVIFHTYHGTKGIEFSNVIIVMGNNFGTERNKFSNYFLALCSGEELDGKSALKFQNTKNLLYVSCSRSMSNLRVLYLDDISGFSDGIKHIFETVSEFEAV